MFLWQREEVQKMLWKAKSLGGTLYERGRLRGHVALAANLCVILGSQLYSPAQGTKVSH